ncbi:MAG: hypothetical protein QG603_128 [Patescibacteria group bacterium]|nr:hypothetical protein [Patescibacteria group bacterium]
MQSEEDRLEIAQTDESKIKQDILAELDSFLLENANEAPAVTPTIDQARLKALKELDRLIKQDLSASEILTRLKSRSENKAPVTSVESKVSDFYSSIHVVDLRHDYPKSVEQKSSFFGKLLNKKKASPEAIIEEKQEIFEPETEQIFSAEPEMPIVVAEEIVPMEQAVSPVETTAAIEQPIIPVEVVSPIEQSIIPVEPVIHEQPAQGIEQGELQSEPMFHEQIAPEIEEFEQKASLPTNYRLAFKQTAIIAIITSLILLPVQGIIFAGKWQSDKDKLLNYGQSGFLAFKSGIIKASENSYHEADVDFANALTDFDSAKSILNKYDTQFLNLGDKLPVVGNTFKSGENILEITSSLSQAAQIINQKREQSSDLTDYIVVLNQQLDELLPLLDDTNKRLDKIVGVPDDLKVELKNLQADLQPILLNLHQLKTITLTLETLLGSEKEQRYLLLFQNNNEIRAAGGFIGSYALLDVNKGKIVQMEIPKGGTYDLTAGQKKLWRSPQALAIVNFTFNIWDANWWPDFPSSAKKITKLFAENSGSSVDGVIAINATVLQKLLRLTGPIDFPEYGVELSADNVIDVLQAEIEGKRNEVNPKTIISDLAPKVLEKIFSSNNKPEDMFVLLAEILQNKDLQIYSTDQSIDKKISDLGWRGEMMETDRDYLWVVNTNIAGGKTDLHVNQLIEHQAVVSENGEVTNTVKVTRPHDGSNDNPFLGLEGSNVSYLRFFVPEGSQLISASGFDTVPEYYFPDNKQYDVDPDLLKEESKLIDKDSKTEIFSSLNRTVFANWQMLKPGETKTVTITYKLPFSLDLGNKLTNDWKKIFLASSRHFDHYSLLVQSQSGQAQTILDSKVILPSDSKIIWQAASAENNVHVQDNETHFNQTLDRDQYFGVVMTSE